jgi:hypothetical protein
LIHLQESSDFDSAIPWFESRRPSEPVSSVQGVSASPKKARQFRRLARRLAVSAAKNAALHGAARKFPAQVSGRDFSISRTV